MTLLQNTTFMAGENLIKPDIGLQKTTGSTLTNANKVLEKTLGSTLTNTNNLPSGDLKKLDIARPQPLIKTHNENLIKPHIKPRYGNCRNAPNLPIGRHGRVNQYNHLPEPSKRKYGANNALLERLSIGLLLAFVLLVPACQPVRLVGIPTDPFASAKINGYDKDLSKTQSGQPYRYSLAFFVPDVCPASQVGHTTDTSTYPQITGVNRHIMPAMATSYDGVTSQNTKASRRICGAVTLCAESEPRHLLMLNNVEPQSVALTQKHKGGHHHA